MENVHETGSEEIEIEDEPISDDDVQIIVMTLVGAGVSLEPDISLTADVGILDSCLMVSGSSPGYWLETRVVEFCKKYICVYASWYQN